MNLIELAVVDGKSDREDHERAYDDQQDCDCAQDGLVVHVSTGEELFDDGYGRFMGYDDEVIVLE